MQTRQTGHGEVYRVARQLTNDWIDALHAQPAFREHAALFTWPGRASCSPSPTDYAARIDMSIYTAWGSIFALRYCDVMQAIVHSRRNARYCMQARRIVIHPTTF